MKPFLLIAAFIVLIIPAVAQESDSLRSPETLQLLEADSAKMAEYAKRYDPRKALLYAAVFPGLGQIYNKKYWKLPLVYGGIGIIGYWIHYYQDIHNEYRGHLFFNLENNLARDNDLNPNVNLETGQLRRIVDRARRERDFMIILMGGMYLLQIVDAHVDAHLKEFDLIPQFKRRVSIEPTVSQSAWAGVQTGISIRFRF